MTLINGKSVTIAKQTAVTVTADEVGSQAGKLPVMLLGDFNRNGKVDGNDFVIYSDVHIKYCQGQPFNPLGDMNNDGKRTQMTSSYSFSLVYSTGAPRKT